MNRRNSLIAPSSPASISPEERAQRSRSSSFGQSLFGGALASALSHIGVVRQSPVPRPSPSPQT
eukprot:EC850613.1.p4 GENE.EC850613.1~~EC850613.1.p4  ORF type:complete len:64 (+),score=13.52 EC850613.1:165-356(+)